MANLTITVAEETLRRARIKALEEGTSVNALLARRLEEYAGETGDLHARQLASLRALDRLADVANARRRRAGHAEGSEALWDREAVYAERVERLGPGATAAPRKGSPKGRR